MNRATLRVFLLVGVAACATAGKTNPPDYSAIPKFNRDSLTTDLTGQRVYALVGSVVDSASGRALQAATVTAFLDTAGKPVVAYTDDSGGFVLGRLQPGPYRIVFRRIGYMPIVSHRQGGAAKIDTLRVRLAVNPNGLSTTAVRDSASVAADLNRPQSLSAADAEVIRSRTTPIHAGPRGCVSDTSSDARIYRDGYASMVSRTDSQSIAQRTAFHLPTLRPGQVTIVTDAATCHLASVAYDKALGVSASSEAPIVLRIGTQWLVIKKLNFPGVSPNLLFGQNFTKQQAGIWF